MHLPLQMEFKNVEATSAIKNAVRTGAARISRYCPSIIGCRVTLVGPSDGHHLSDCSRVQLQVTMPGTSLAVNQGQHCNIHEDLEIVIHDAFDTMQHKIDNWLTSR